MTAPAIRAALERLITMASDELATPGLWAHSRASWDDAIAAARAALDAAPEGEPSDEELYDLAELFNGDPVPAMRRALELWGRPAAPPAPTTKELKELEGWLQEMLGSPSAAAAAQWETNIKYLSRFLRMADSAFLRQQLLQQENHRFREPERTILCDILANGTLLPDPDGTRYGIPAAPPAPLEGEAGKLARLLREEVRELRDSGTGGHLTDDERLRAAALLEQDQGSVKSAPSLTIAPAPAVVPVAVSERLPGGELCWWYEPDEDDDGSGYGGNWTLLRIRGGVSCYTHWLPAHALPLPAPQGGEGEG